MNTEFWYTVKGTVDLDELLKERINMLIDSLDDASRHIENNNPIGAAAYIGTATEMARDIRSLKEAIDKQ